MGQQCKVLEIMAGECDWERQKAEVASENAEVASMDASNGNSHGEASKGAQTGSGIMLKRDMGKLQMRITEMKNSVYHFAQNPRNLAATMSAAGAGVMVGAGVLSRAARSVQFLVFLLLLLHLVLLSLSVLWSGVELAFVLARPLVAPVV